MGGPYGPGTVTIQGIPVILDAKNSGHGYAAYQFTLIPYALMSFMNIVSSFLTPTYPAVYMVKSKIMEEAISRGGRFDGTVGELCEEEVDDREEQRTNLDYDKDRICFTYADCDELNLPKRKVLSIFDMITDAFRYIVNHLIHEHLRREIYIGRYYWRVPGRMTSSNVRRIFRTASQAGNNLIMVSPFGHPKFRLWRIWDTRMTIVADLSLTVSLVVPYIVMGFVSKFENGDSKWYQRALLMTWLVFGQVSHFFQRMFWGYLQARVAPLGTKYLNGILLLAMIISASYALAAAGGFGVVGAMKWEDLGNSTCNDSLSTSGAPSCSSSPS